MQTEHVFSCAFGGGVTATATVDLNAAREGREAEEWISLRYDGTITPAHLPLYRTWMLDVNQKVADLVINRVITWGFRPGDDGMPLELYQFEAGKAYRRVR